MKVAQIATEGLRGASSEIMKAMKGRKKMRYVNRELSLREWNKWRAYGYLEKGKDNVYRLLCMNSETGKTVWCPVVCYTTCKSCGKYWEGQPLPDGSLFYTCAECNVHQHEVVN